MFRKCPCLRPPNDDVRVLDYRHCSLDHVPSEIFNFERTLEELLVDANQIKDLPRELFYCHGIRKLSLSDNEITCIPPAVASLINLEELDISKNGILEIPENIKCCKQLNSVEASVNPLGKLPEGFTQLLNITQLYLNDTFLDYLPGNFGRLSKLKVLELRENHLKTLPKSLSRLTALERLDIGNNDFSELPEVVGSMTSLLEFWCDSNYITNVPASLGNLKQLIFLDASKNRIEWVPSEIEGCDALSDLYLSTNMLTALPESIGRLSNLTILKVDDNRLTSLPFSIGGLVSLSELNVSANDIEEIPPSIGLLRHLRTLHADENFIMELPPEMGSCNGLTVLSLRSNSLTYIPDEIGRIPRLRVLTLSDNRIRYLPFSLMRLKQLQALWLSENQSKPLIKLQTDIDVDTGQRMLTCYLLPQQPSQDKDGMSEDETSFHPSMWEEERARRQQIQFQCEDASEAEGNNLHRIPTPYPKEMKQHQQHIKNLAVKQSNLPNGAVARSNSQSEIASKGSSSSLKGVSGKPTSPLLQERHHLLKADKEKQAKDKAKMHRNSPAEKGGKSQTDGSGKSLREAPSPIKSPGSSSKEAHDKDKSSSKDRSKHGRPRRAEEDDGGFLSGKDEPSTARRSHSSSSINKPQPQQNYMNPSRSYSSAHQWSQNQQPHHGGPPGQPSSQDTSRDSGYTSALPPLPYFDYRKPKHSRRLRDYDSDTGYRSDHDAYRHRHHHPPNYRSDGYASDWDAVPKMHARRSHREGGYSSDMDGYSQRSRVHSYHTQHPRHSHQNVPYHAQSYHHTQSYHNTSSNSTSKPLPYNNYSNVPLTKRMTIRNDEMYEQQFKNTPSMPDLQVSSTPKDKFFTQAPPYSSSVRSLNQAPATSAAPSRHPSNKQLSQFAQNSGSVESEEWKRELYKASVRLAKSPGDSKNKHDFSVSDDNTSNVGGKSADPAVVSGVSDTVTRASPPPYHPAPPYSHPADRHTSTPGHMNVTTSSSIHDLVEEMKPLDLRSSRPDLRPDEMRSSRPDLRPDDMRSSRPDLREAPVDLSTSRLDISQQGEQPRPAHQDQEGGLMRSSRPDLTQIGNPPQDSRRRSRDSESDMMRRERTDSQSSHELASRMLDSRAYANSPHRLETRSHADSPHRLESEHRAGYRDSPNREYRQSPNRYSRGDSGGSYHRDSPRTDKNYEDSRTLQADDKPTPHRAENRTDALVDNRQSPRVDPQNQGNQGNRNSPRVDSSYKQSPLIKTDYTDSPHQPGSGMKGSRRELQFSSNNNNNDSYTDSPVPYKYNSMTPFNSVSNMQQGAHNNSGMINQSGGLLQTPAHNPSPIAVYRGVNHNLMTPYNSTNNTPIQESGSGGGGNVPNNNTPVSHHPRDDLRLTVLTNQTPRRASTDMMIAPQNSLNQTGGFDDSSLMIPYFSQTPNYANQHQANYMPPQSGSDSPHQMELPGYMTQTTIVTQFDKDVAMFKGNGEPTSQVSSSTDSGYHGHHLYERLPENRSRGGASPQSRPSPSLTTYQNPGFTQPQPPMPYSRESTPARNEDRTSDPQQQYDVPDVFRIVLNKNPGLGFSIAGGTGSLGNPFRPDDMGIFITKVQPGGPADILLRPGDKILEVNGIDFSSIEHTAAVNTLKNCQQSVNLLVERV